MLVVKTTERPEHPVGQFIRAQQSIELHDLALAMNPFGLDGVQPRALLRQKATDDPYPTAALLDFSIVFAEPSSDLPGDVPACVVPDEKKGLLAKSFEQRRSPQIRARASKGRTTKGQLHGRTEVYRMERARRYPSARLHRGDRVPYLHRLRRSCGRGSRAPGSGAVPPLRG